MEAIVDGIIFELQSQGGISRLFKEIFPRMCCIDESLRLKLLFSTKPKQSLPEHPNIRNSYIPSIDHILRPERLWQPFLPTAKHLARKLWVSGDRNKIWHSTYYSLYGKWKGPIIFTVYDLIYEKYSYLFNSPVEHEIRQRMYDCIRKATTLISISETTKIDLQHHYDIQPEKIHAIQLGYSPQFRILEADENESLYKKPYMLFVGMRSHHKNFHTLIKAYSVWKRRGEIDLVAVGQPWSKDEQKLLIELGIVDQVHLSQNTNDEALCKLYNQAVAFIYPSLYEGFGIPLLEAMACGCPIAASRIPTTIEIAGDIPIYFEPLTIDSLLGALDDVIANSRDQQRIQLGLERAKQFSWDRTARKTLNVYRSLTGEGSL